MTQRKKSKTDKQVVMQSAIAIAQNNLNNTFRAFNKGTQDIVINFFNLHNAASLLFGMLDKDAQEYVEQCIALSQELNEKSE